MVKKLPKNYTISVYECVDTINDLIDLANSQQEAIEKLESVVSQFEYQRDNDKPADDTHRTVTLRIPKGMTVGEAIFLAWKQAGEEINLANWLGLSPDDELTQALKALDEVEHE